ncbi:MAG: hypothetical protein ACX93U_23775 [Salipiger thiooxidans]|jgi:hypothetical protein|uniref:hypothetical protein n=1 Tax=Salipiger thiooxidans TaxID=282683 RepID=UPI001A8CFD24|nr:hypothetical protein [Salipiger thiooxidans]MBN8189263.1 hypothetical protein [Salipiger thiooxidans]
MSVNLRMISSVEDLPEYPLPAGTRLKSHSYFFFHYDDWLNSDFFTRTVQRGDWAVQAVAHVLWCKSRYQDPVGTLPTDPALLAGLAQMSVDAWEGYACRDINPLYGWYRCRIPGSGEVRLMHDKVTAVVLEATESRHRSEDRALADKERQAIKRLRETVAKLADERLSENLRYIVTLHRWLDETYPTGNRTLTRIIDGMDALGTTAWRA